MTFEFNYRTKDNLHLKINVERTNKGEISNLNKNIFSILGKKCLIVTGKETAASHLALNNNIVTN